MSRRHATPFFPLTHLQTVQVSPNQAPSPPSVNQGANDSAPNPPGVEIPDFRNVRRSRNVRTRSVEVNNVYDHLRQFLSDKRLHLRRNIPTNYREALETLAPPADHLEVQSYTNRSIDWPGQPRISWDDPLGSPWNKQAISMLVLEFIDTVHHCLYPKLQTLPSFASVDWLYAAIETRLGKTRCRLRKLLRPLTQHETSEEQNNRLQDEASRAATQSRRRERRNKRFNRRKSTAGTKASQDETGHWPKISEILQYFTKDDMSSDETEVEESFQTHKRIRRIRKAWVDESVSRLWRYVDSQYGVVQPSGRPKRGVKVTLREWVSTSQDSDAEPAPGLPVNFYGKSIQGAKLASLKPRPPVVIPEVFQQQGSMVEEE